LFDDERGQCFDIYPPRDFYGNSLAWAKMNSMRMTSFGYNAQAVPAGCGFDPEGPVCQVISEADTPISVYIFEYGTEGQPIEEVELRATSLAAAWQEFYRLLPGKTNVRCFKEGFGFIADQSSYKEDEVTVYCQMAPKLLAKLGESSYGESENQSAG
jgi:hypothetical protein